jgi:hypothetical protein
MDVETIKAAITTLSEHERRALADWLQELEDRAWDVEMESDLSTGGRAQALADKIDREIDEGKFTPLDEGIRSRQGRR